MRTVGGASKYRSGDSPRSVRTRLRRRAVHSDDRPLARPPPLTSGYHVVLELVPALGEPVHQPVARLDVELAHRRRRIPPITTQGMRNDRQTSVVPVATGNAVRNVQKAEVVRLVNRHYPSIECHSVERELEFRCWIALLPEMAAADHEMEGTGAPADPCDDRSMVGPGSGRAREPARFGRQRPPFLGKPAGSRNPVPVGACWPRPT